MRRRFEIQMQAHGPQDLVFRHNEILYDAATMIRLIGDASGNLAFYLTRDRSLGFRVTLDEVGNYQVSSVDAAELRALVGANRS